MTSTLDTSNRNPLDTSNRNPLDESVRSVAQEGVKQKDLHEAYVTLLDGRKLSVQVHKNADGEVLFNLVTNAIGLIEKDYFALAFYDNNVRKWLYTKKKISKQIKELPWEFSLEVKFYVPDPRQLNEDFTRHLFTLQLRIDLYEARLPAVILNQAKLGSLIAQAELGDYKPDCQYYEALKGLNIVRTMSPELAEKIIQFYKEQKGKTPPEAELAFLLECRENSMYGMAVFDATERNKPVRIGINASGISIFNDQLRRYIIIWQSMHQLEFQRKTFTIRLKPGEKEGKNSLSYKLDSEGAAKRCWKTAVEHHTFFRLVQPDDKNRRLFGSGTFRHEGRTLFQTQMASQMFDGTQVTGPHIAPSHLITQSGENITSHTEFSSAPFQKQADENTQPEFMATSGHHASKSPREAFSPQSTNGTTSEVGCSSSFAPAVQEQALSLNTSAAKPLFVTTTLVTSSSAEPSVLSRDVSQSLSPQLIQQLSSPHQTLRQEASELPTFEAQAIWQRGSSMSPASFHAVPTLLTSAWFSKRQRSLTPRPQTIVIEPDSAQFTTKAKTTTNMTRSATASPYAQMIPESGELFLPIVREMHQQTMTTLMTLPSRSHTVLAEYLSTTDTSHLSPDLISAYRNLLTAGGNTPSQAEEKIRSILNNRVYCRRSPLSPPTLNSPLPPDVEFACKTRSPSPTVRFDESVNHCIRIKIVEVNNETPIYQYNVSAAEAHRAAVRGGYSPSRQGYTSLTREEGNRQEVQETPKRSFFGQRKRRHPQPFLRAENTPIYNLRKDDELQEDPIRFHSNVYHSGLSGRQIVRRFRHTGVEEIREVTTEEYSYLNRDKLYEEPERLEKEAGELQSQNIRSVVNKRSSPQRSKRRRFTPSRPHFSTPTSVFNLRSRRQDSHDHTNGFASLDLSPIPATQPSTSYYKEMPSDKITELIVQTTDVEPSKSGQVEISGQVVSRNRRYRFFTRSHPQQERSIERPDYRLDTSVFVGVPEDLKRGIEVEHQPIKEHCSPYYKHSYTRKTKKTTTKIGRTEESDEESAPEVEDTEETQKRTARIHLKSGEHEPEKQRVSRSLFAKKEARPKKAEVLKQQRLPTITEPYTGPLDPLEQQKEFGGATFEECVVVCRPSTSETTQIVEEKPSELKKAESPEKSKTKHGLFGFLKETRSSYPPIEQPYEGPLEVVPKAEELSGDRLRQHVDIYHSGYSLLIRNRRYRFFTRERHEGEEEIVEKFDPSVYKLDVTPFEGTAEALHKDSDFESHPIRSTCQIYHPGISYVRRKQKKAKPGHEDSETSSSESDHVQELTSKKRPSKSQLKTTEEVQTTTKTTRLFKFTTKQKTSQMPEIGGEPYAGELNALRPSSEFESKLFDECVTSCQPSSSGEQVKIVIEEAEPTKSTAKLFLKSREVEMPPQKKDKSAKKSRIPFSKKLDLSSYPSRSEVFETTEVIGRDDNIEQLPISEFSTIYHPGTSYDVKKQPIAVEEIKQPEEHVSRTAKITVRSKEVETDEPVEEPKSSKFFAFTKRQKTDKEPTALDLSSYPQKSDPIETTEVIGRDEHLDSSPLEEHVSRTAKITVRSKEVETDEPKTSQQSFFAFTKRQKTDKEPTALDLSSYPQKSDPIETSNVISRDEHLESLPISEYSTTYHPGTSYDVKKQPIEKQPEFEEHVGRTAKIVVKSKEVETEAPKSSKFFAFTKRQKEPKLSSMPQIGEMYQGPVEQLNRSNDADLSPLEEHGVNVQSIEYPTTSTQIIEVPHGKTAKIVVKSKEVEMPSQKKSRIPFSKKLDLSSYPQKTEVFETTEVIGRDEHLDSSPLEEHGINVQSVDYPTTSTQIIEVPHGRTAKITIRSTQITEEPESVVDIEKKPKTKKSLLEFTSVTRRFKSDKEPKLSSMPQIGEVYEGPVEELKRDPDHETSNINSFVDYVYVETPTDDKKSQKIKIIIEQPSEQSDEGQQKQTAVLHIRSLEDEESEQSEVPKEQKRSVFGFLRRGEKKHEEKAKSPSTSSYPLPIAPDDSILYDTSKDPELEESPLAAHIEIREPEVPIKVEALQKRPDYPLHEAPFEGNLESTVRVEDFEQHPILDYSSVYHPGTITKTKAPKPAKKEKQVEESPEKQTAHIHTTTTEHEVHETSPTKEGKSLFGYFKGKKSDEPSTSYQFDVEPYTGPLDLIQKDEFNEDPLSSHVEIYYDGPDSADVSKVKKRESHQEIKLETRKNGYPAQEEEYSGPLEVLTPSSDVENLQLGQVVDVNEENQVLIEQYIKLQKLKKSEKQGKQSIAEEETEEHQRKLAAKIHVKSDDEEQLEASKPKSLFGFLKSSKSKKHDEDIESPKSPDYPTIVLPSDFQAPPINKEDEIEESPLELPEATLITTHKRYRLFMRDEGEKENLGKSPYPFDKEPYEGQLEFIEHSENLEPVPINQYVNVYYNEKIHGKRRLKMPKIKLPEREVKTAEESSSRPEKKTALIRLKEKEDVPEQQVESRFWRKHRPEKDDQQRTILSNAVYGLSSEQFDVSDELNRQKDFNSEPIKEHVDVKHPGFSTTKSKAPRKLEELDPNADKKTAVLHLRSIENIDENLSHTSSDTPAFFGFLRGRKGKKKEDHSYPAIEQPYIGELDLLKPDEQLFEDPNIIVASLVAYPDTVQKPKVQKDIEDVPQDKKTAIIHLKHEEIVDVPEAHDESKQSSFFAFKRKQKEVVSQYPKSDSYQGPLEIVTKDDELIEDPNIIISSTISSPTELSPTTRKRQLNLFLRKKSEPEESAKETKVSYNFDPTEYTGDYDSLHHSEFDQSLLSEHVAPTQQPTEKSKLKLFGFGQKSAEEKLDEEEPKQTAILHLKTTEFVEEPTVVKEVKQKRRKTKEIITTYPTRTVYEGELESTKRDDELETDPNFVVPETISYPEERQVKGLKLFLRHEKPQKLEEEVVVVRRTAYDFDPAKFEGEHQNLQHEDFPQSPLSEHVELPAETILPETTAKKSTALITLKTTEQQEETPVEVVKEKKRWSLIPQRKTKEIATSYPISEQFTGELESTKRDDELEVEELEKKIDVEDKETARIHLKTTEFVEEPKVVKEVKQKKRKTKEIAITYPTSTVYEGDYDPLHYNEIEVDPNFIVPETAKLPEERQVKGLKLFLRKERPEKITTSAYDFDPAKFEGELESTSRVNDFTQSPLSEHVDLPSELQEEVPAEAKEKKSTALITFKTTEFVEEPKAEKKRKTKELPISQYPKSDLYEGDYDPLHYNEIEVDSSFVVPETAKYSADRQVKGLKLFLRRQPHEETATTSTKSAYDFSTTPFEGEHQDLSKTGDFVQSPISEHVDLSAQPIVVEEVKVKRVSLIPKRKEKELPVSKYPTSETYTGEYEVIERPNELEVDPDFVIQQISYSPESPTKTSKGLKIFTRHEESVEEPKVEEKRTSWSFLPRRKTKEITTSYPTSEPFTDEVEEIRKDEFAQSPLSEHVETPAEVVEPVKQKPTALITLKKVEQQEETPTEVKQKAKGPSFFAFTRKTKEVVTKSAYDFDPAKFEGEHQHLNRDNEFEADPSNIIQVAEIKYPDVERNVKGLKIFTRHEEPQKAASVTKSAYDFDPTAFEGEYDPLHHSDIEQSLLSDHVAPTQHPAESIVVEETPAEITEKRASWSFIPKRKEKEVVSQYPTSEEFVGDYEEIKPNEEFVTDLNIITPSDVPYPQPTSPQGRLLKLFLREKHPGEEEVAEEKSKYSFDTTAFEGDYDPLHREHFTQSTLEDFVAPTQQPIETSLLTTKVEESPETEERRWSLLFKSKEKTEKHDYPVDVEEYSGPYEVVSRHQEVETDPDFIIQQIAYPEPSSKIGKGLHIFTREKDEKPSIFDSTPFVGDYDSLHHADIKTSPLLDFVAPTQQPVEVSSLTTKLEESPETEERRWSLLIKRKEPTGVKKPAYDFDLTPFAGEYEIVSRHQEIETDPSFAIQQISYLPEPSSKTGKGLHIFTRHEKEQPISQYPTSDPFIGTHELLSYDDLDVSPILDYVDVIISPPTELEAPERKSTALITLKKSEEPPTKIKEVKEKKSWSLVPQRKQKDIYSYPGHEIYIGPYETLQKNEQLEAFPLSEHVELREAEPIKQKSTALIKLKEEQEPVVEEKRTSWSLIPKRKTKEIATTSAYDFDPAKFEGDYDIVVKSSEFESDPSFVVPETAKLPEERQVKGLKLSLRHEKPEQIATTSAYDFDPAKFEDEHQELGKHEDFTQSPLSEHVDLPSEVVEPVKQKSTALITFKTTEFVEEPKVEEISKKKRKTKELLVSQYPKSDLYEGELEELRRNDEFETDPSNIIQVADVKYPESTSKTGKGLHIFTRHEESVEEISKKKRKTKEVKKSSYVFDSTPFTGESEELRRSSEVEIDPDFVIQQIAYPESTSKTGKGLHIFTRHEESVVEEPKVEKKRKTKELLVSKYPTSVYTGEYHQISRDGEFETDPNIIQVAEVKYPDSGRQVKGLKIFTRNEESVPTKSAYDFDSTEYSGNYDPLHHSDIEALPLSEHVSPTQQPDEIIEKSTLEESPSGIKEKKRISWTFLSGQKGVASQYPTSTYEGELEELRRDGEFETDPNNIIQVAEIKYPDSERHVKGLKIFTRNEESAEEPKVEEIPAEITEKRASWSFLPARKQKEVVSQYPTSEPYVGEMSTTKRDDEFETDPNIIQITEVKYPSPQGRILKLFLRERHEGVEEIGEEKSRYEFSKDAFEGEYDSLHHTDIEASNLSDLVAPTQHPIEPVIVEEVKVKRVSLIPKRKEKEVSTTYPTSEPYTGEYHQIDKSSEVEIDPDFVIQQIAYPESKTGKGLHIFMRGKEEKPPAFDNTPFTGTYDPLHRNELEAAPLTDFVELPIKKTTPESEIEVSEPIKQKSTALITLKQIEKEPVVEEKKSWSLLPKRKTKEITTSYPTNVYTGEYQEIRKDEEFEADPNNIIQVVYPETTLKTGKGLKIFTRGKEPIEVKTSSYDFDLAKFEGEHQNLQHEDFTQSPLSEHVELPAEVVEPITEEIKEKKRWSLIPKRKEITTSYLTSEPFTGEYQEIRKDDEFEADPNIIQASEVSYPETTSKTGKGLKIFTRNEEGVEEVKQEPIVTEEKRTSWSLLPRRKTKELIVSQYPTSEPFVGELQSTNRDSEFETDPNIIQVAEVKYPETSRHRGLKIFTRHEGVEEVGEEKSKYSFDATAFEGEYDPLHHTDIKTTDLTDFVAPTQQPAEPVVVEEVKVKRKTKEIATTYPTSEPFIGEYDSLHHDDELETDPSFVIQQISYSPEPTAKIGKGLHIFTRGKEPLEVKKPKYPKTESYEGTYDSLQRNEFNEEEPLSKHVSLYHQDLPPLEISQRLPEPTTSKQTALIYLKSTPEQLKPALKIEAEPSTKPAKQSIWSVFRKRRRAESPSGLEPVAAARRIYESELVGGMAIGNASLFKSGEPVTDLDIDLFLRKHETSQYHVELLLRDLRTTEFPVLFDGRRGPKFLPRSLLEASNDEAYISLREPRSKRPKPDPSQQQPPEDPQESEEGDVSSMASLPSEDNETPKRHKLHHKQHQQHESSSQTTTLKSDRIPPQTEQKSSLLQQLFQIGKKSSKSPAKEELKRKLSSSSSDEEVEIEERHKVQSSTTAPHKVLNKEHDSSSKRSERTTDNMFKTITNYANELKSEGPYTPANDKHGQVIRHEKVDQVYRITGAGQIPHFDPTDPETNPPRTTLQSWHEKTVGPETVTEEVDEHGNLIRKTIKTEQVKHTVQKQSYQTYTVDDDKPQSPSDLKQTLDSIQSISSSIPTSLPSGQTHVLVYGRDGELREPLQNEQFDENQSVSTKVVTTGNRTIETITYKNVKDGVVHTNVEHRVTITGPEIDQDAELRRAIAEATGLNPKYEVQRIEIKEERLQ